MLRASSRHGACAANVENIHAANSNLIGAAPLVNPDVQGSRPQGLVTVRPEPPYAARFGAFVVTRPFRDMIARGFPNFDPYRRR